MIFQRSDAGPAPRFHLFRNTLQRIERGKDAMALRWQAFFAVVDLAILAFFLFGPYLRAGPSYLIIDYLIAVWIGAELLLRIVAAPTWGVLLRRPMTWIDIVILATLLFPDVLYNFAFLRAMRLWAVGNSTLLRVGLRRAGYPHLLDVVRALINLLVFLFIATGFVYTSFFYNRPGEEGFVDALYFTVATITTTGISLFVRLAQAVVRPNKVHYPCPRCGLQRHDSDAVHCKACGEILNIPDEGD